jgi:hypothetical protein
MNTRTSLVRIASFLALTTAAAGCNGSSTSAISAAEGGTVTASTHDVAIPAMSLATDTEVTVETADASGYPELEGALPEVLRIEPEGTVLEVPATVTIHADFTGAGADDSVSVYQLRDVDGVSTWSPMESSTDAETGDVTVSVSRFAPLAVTVTAASSAAEIRGTLSWGSGDPAAEAPVQLYQADTLVTETTTGADGSFSFADLEPGAYRVVVDYECSLDEAVEVAAGDVEELTLTLCGG